MSTVELEVTYMQDRGQRGRLLLKGVAFLIALTPNSALAQVPRIEPHSLPSVTTTPNWAPEQQEIWTLEEAMWRRDTAKDLTWIDTFVHPNATSWGLEQPVPRNRASVARWDKYEYGNTTVLEYELFPLSIAITGNVAVVHYRYRLASENYKKERETVTGRYTDVLIKDGARWLLIATVGGDDPKR